MNTRGLILKCAVVVMLLAAVSILRGQTANDEINLKRLADAVTAINSNELNETAKRVLVVTQDSDAPKSDRAFYVGTDNVAAGRVAGDLVKEALPQGGKIRLFVGRLDARNAQERLQGIREALQGSNIEIIDVRTDDTDRVRAKSNVSDALVRHSDVAGLVGLWSYNGPAILNAIKDANKVGQVKIIAFDEEDETLSGVKQGAIYATIVQQPFEFGYQAIKLMEQYLRATSRQYPQRNRSLFRRSWSSRTALTSSQRRSTNYAGADSGCKR